MSMNNYIIDPYLDFVRKMGLPTNGGKVRVKFGHQNTMDENDDLRIGTTLTIDEYINKWGIHAGVDIDNPDNMNILSVDDGVVVSALSSNINGGNKLVIEHNVDGRSVYSFYFHLDSIGVKVGQDVQKGEIIGVMGDSGTRGYTHLHFEVRTFNGSGGRTPFTFPFGHDL